MDFSSSIYDKIFPINDFNIEIVNFGFQDVDPNHKQLTMLKSENVLQYIISGEGFLKIEGKTYELSKGDMFFLPKNVLLSYWAKPNNPYVYYWIGIDGTSAKKLLEKIGLTAKSPIIKYSDDKILKAYLAIKDALDENTFAAFVLARGETLKLLAVLLSYSKENTQKLKSVSVQYVEKAIDFIKDNYNSDIRVSEIAAEIGLGRNYFSVIFSKHTGMPPVEYLMRYRIEQSQKMLKQGFSVTDTAISCGFNSPSNFSVQFKRISGVTPYGYKVKF